MNSIDFFTHRFNTLQGSNGSNGLGQLRARAFQEFNRLGIPSGKNEEWKYTRIGPVFNKEFRMVPTPGDSSLSRTDVDRTLGLPGQKDATVLVFVNGFFSRSLSNFTDSNLSVMSLEEAASGEAKQWVAEHLGQSSHYVKDGIQALNTALLQGGLFLEVRKGVAPTRPVHVYHVADLRFGTNFSQPRILVRLGQEATLQLLEISGRLGDADQDNLSNQVIEIVVEKGAKLEHARIQNDGPRSSQVSTTHIRQVGASYAQSTLISLSGSILRNNVQVVFEAAACEAHLYGLYCLRGTTHVDNHTVVDNLKPQCFSNELFKGILDEGSTGVFNGKIFVRKDAQKTNAYQSNKNILLSDQATVNAKPQLEIFADDVKCSHGCTVGTLDEDALFYLRSRGLSPESARAQLLKAYAMDILEKISHEPIRQYVDRLISERLAIDAS
jgi:Fe-S cluster assembly protein SufD